MVKENSDEQDGQQDPSPARRKAQEASLVNEFRQAAIDNLGLGEVDLSTDKYYEYPTSVARILSEFDTNCRTGAYLSIEDFLTSAQGHEAAFLFQAVSTEVEYRELHGQEVPSVDDYKKRFRHISGGEQAVADAFIDHHRREQDRED